MGFWYDWSKIDGYKCPVKCVVSRRGLGKTFSRINLMTLSNIFSGHKFIYVVETGEMVKELCKNDGEKFFVALFDYYAEQNTSKKKYIYPLLDSTFVKSDDEEDSIFKKGKKGTLVSGGTIVINGKTAGYIVDLNSYAELKRNNFNGVKYIFIDEFISEKLDRTSLENPKKISSIIQSVARLRDVIVFMCGNSVRLDDPILARLGFKIDGYGIYKIYDEFGLLMVLDFVDPALYPKFKEKHDRSVAGRFAKAIGEDNEEENRFVSDLPDSRRLGRILYKKNSRAMNIVKDNITLSIRELQDGNYAVIPFSGRGDLLYCLTEKEQGYHMGKRIICNKALRQVLQDMLRGDKLRYYSEVEYVKLKNILIQK